MNRSVDVVVVGGGNAGFCAALAAKEGGANKVLLLEKASPAWSGGNSYFTAGAFRLTYDSLDDLSTLINGDVDLAAVVIDSYGSGQYFADLMRVTEGRSDPHLARILAAEARAAAEWLSGHGVKWELMYERQSFRVGGKTRFWGNLPAGTVGGGAGLMAAMEAAASANGIEVRYSTPVIGLLVDDGRVRGVRSDAFDVFADATVLAAGGFESDARRRAMYLGPSWELAKVRGTPHNTGEVLEAAIAIGAAPRGHWSGCHAIAWDDGAGAHGDRAMSNRWSRQGYPYGLVVNRAGKRFVDEGADYRNYTYAKYGAEILKQPGAVAFQLFDSQSIRLIGETDYSTAAASKKTADSIADLARLAGIDPHGLEQEIELFNSSVKPGDFDPTRRDGKGTEGVWPPKSNWALPLTEPPFYAFRVTCGVTFTFGGLSTDDHGRVLNTAGDPIPGLFTAGEMLGGLFYHNYPGGSGLASGAVFGRRAGFAAAETASKRTRTEPRTGPETQSHR